MEWVAALTACDDNELLPGDNRRENLCIRLLDLNLPPLCLPHFIRFIRFELCFLLLMQKLMEKWGGKLANCLLY